MAVSHSIRKSSHFQIKLYEVKNMEVIFKGVKDGEEKPINLEEGKLYWAIRAKDMGGGAFEYHIKSDKQHIGTYPAKWFINLNSLEAQYSAIRGILSQPVSIGGGMGAQIVTIPRNSNDGIPRKLCTSPVVMAEEIAHNWILFKTSSEHYYIGHYCEN